MDTLFPIEIITYLQLFAPVFSANHFKYFQGFMLGYMLLGQTRKCVTNIARVCFLVDRHISSWERFLCQYPWDVKAIQSRLVTLLTEQLGEKLWICGAFLAFVDTTLVPKVEGKMLGVQKWHDPSGNADRGMYLVGYHWAVSGLLGVSYLGGQYTPLAFPILSSLISGNTNPVGFIADPQGVAQTLNFWEAVCPVVSQLLQMLANCPLRVVADAYFSKAPFINAMVKRNIQVITRMRKDAIGWDDPTPEPSRPPGQKKRGRKPTKPRKAKRWNIATLIQHFPVETVSVFIYGQVQTLSILSRDLFIRDVDA
ncbi:MAG: transposase, partial [Nitrospira sp.]|nr:transposase [Nitrospira sp.]